MTDKISQSGRVDETRHPLGRQFPATVQNPFLSVNSRSPSGQADRTGVREKNLPVNMSLVSNIAPVGGAFFFFFFFFFFFHLRAGPPWA